MTRAHLLTEQVNVARVAGDTTAFVHRGRAVIGGKPITDYGLLPREARQLAWALCEAADRAEEE